MREMRLTKKRKRFLCSANIILQTNTHIHLYAHKINKYHLIRFGVRHFFYFVMFFSYLKPLTYYTNSNKFIQINFCTVSIFFALRQYTQVVPNLFYIHTHTHIWWWWGVRYRESLTNKRMKSTKLIIKFNTHYFSIFDNQASQNI